MYITNCLFKVEYLITFVIFELLLKNVSSFQHISNFKESLILIPNVQTHTNTHTNARDTVEHHNQILVNQNSD